MEKENGALLISERGQEERPVTRRLREIREMFQMFENF
jgi:hypothetical protein